MSNDQERLLSLEMVIKAADVSNCAKPFSLYKRWANQIMIEFYKQGDIERNDGMKISNYFDRFEPDVSTCQLNFMKFIVCPLYELVGAFAPTLRDMYSSKLKTNVKFWEKQQMIEMGIRGRADSIDIEDSDGSDNEDDIGGGSGGGAGSKKNKGDEARIKLRRRSSLAARGEKNKMVALMNRSSAQSQSVSAGVGKLQGANRRRKKKGDISLARKTMAAGLHRRNTRIASTLKASRALGSLDGGIGTPRPQAGRALPSVSSMPGGMVGSTFDEAEQEKRKAKERAKFRSSLGRRETAMQSAEKFGSRFKVLHVPSLSDVLQPSETGEGGGGEGGEGGGGGDGSVISAEEERKMMGRRRQSRIERRMSVSFL